MFQTKHSATGISDLSIGSDPTPGVFYQRMSLGGQSWDFAGGNHPGNPDFDFVECPFDYDCNVGSHDLCSVCYSKRVIE